MQEWDVFLGEVGVTSKRTLVPFIMDRDNYKLRAWSRGRWGTSVGL